VRPRLAIRGKPGARTTTPATGRAMSAGATDCTSTADRRTVLSSAAQDGTAGMNSKNRVARRRQALPAEQAHRAVTSREAARSQLVTDNRPNPMRTAMTHHVTRQSALDIAVRTPVSPVDKCRILALPFPIE
jgi:hypothetical protein